MRHFLLLIFSAVTLHTFAAGSGTEIKITVKQLANKPFVLANYYGDKQYIKDTFQFDKNGVCLIKIDSVLPAGIYLGVFPSLNNKYFEFIVNEPKIVITTDTSDISGHLKAEVSNENKLFYQDIAFLNEKRKEIEKYNAEYKAATDEKAKENAKKELQKIDEEVRTERLAIEKNNPKTFYSTLLRSMREVELPKDGPRDDKGVLTDSAWQWRFYKNHFWDNFDFKAYNLIRTPVFHNKLDQYYKRVLVQNPDSLIKGGDELLAKMNPQEDLFRYALVYMLNEMAASKIMGMDAVYTHLVNNYYAKGFAPWVDSASLYRIVERGKILEPLLIGKPARPLILPDSTLKNYKSLYAIPNRFTILAFWDPDCGHCKKEIPKLAELYHKMKKDGIDVEVMGVGIFDIAEMDKWTAFIREHNLDWINVADPNHQNNFRYEWDIQSTPQLYILDKEKRIKAKRIGVENIEDILKHEIDPTYIPKNKAPLVEDKETEAH